VTQLDKPSLMPASARVPAWGLPRSPTYPLTVIRRRDAQTTAAGGLATVNRRDQFHDNTVGTLNHHVLGETLNGVSQPDWRASRVKRAHPQRSGESATSWSDLPGAPWWNVLRPSDRTRSRHPQAEATEPWTRTKGGQGGTATLDPHRRHRHQGRQRGSASSDKPTTPATPVATAPANPQ